MATDELSKQVRNTRPPLRSSVMPSTTANSGSQDLHLTVSLRLWAHQLIDSYMERGGNFFDTANVYEGGKSEILLGKILAQRRSKAVIATKFAGCMDPSDPNSGGNSRKTMAEALDASLKRMGIGTVDLFYVHFWLVRAVQRSRFSVRCPRTRPRPTPRTQRALHPH